MATVELFYDVVSPYAYVGFEVLHRYKDAWGLKITYKPFFLGGVMSGAGNTPPAMLPSRGKWMLKDVRRNSAHFQIPLKQPTVFPANTLTAQRVLTALVLSYPEKVEVASRNFWDFYWGQDKDIGQIDIIREVLSKSGFNETQIDEVLKMANTPEVKETLKKTTEDAVARGAYGAPTMFMIKTGTTKPEMFFGSDRFHHIADYLGTTYDGPFPKGDPRCKAKL